VTELESVGWSELKSRHITSGNAPDFELSPDLTFVLDDPPSMQGAALVFRGVLQNPTDEEQVVVTADLGANACGFSVRFEEAAPVTCDGPPVPPAPPAPRELKVPARTAVRFRTSIDLWKYAYEGTPTVLVRWRFGLWGGKSPAGALEVTLPPRPERPKPTPGGPPMPM
jgi:hypothetical protein